MRRNVVYGTRSSEFTIILTLIDKVTMLTKYDYKICDFAHFYQIIY